MKVDKCISRLKNVLVLDKQQNPLKIIEVLKSDIIQVLSNYMEIDYEDVDLNIVVNQNGTYDLELKSIVRRVKPLQTFMG